MNERKNDMLRSANSTNRTARTAAVLALTLAAGAAAASPVDMFVDRAASGDIQFLGWDPADPGNPAAAPTELMACYETPGFTTITFEPPPVGSDFTGRGWGSWIKGGAKTAVVVGSTAGGALGGAAAGTALPGLGTAAGGVIGGAAGLLVGAGSAILANCLVPEQCVMTQDLMIYDQIIVQSENGPIDLAGIMKQQILFHAARQVQLPGGGVMVEPHPELFQGAFVRAEPADGEAFTPFVKPAAEIVVVLIDADGDLGTDDGAIGVIYQDLTVGITKDDQLHIPLDGIMDTSVLSEGDPILASHAFAQTVDEGGCPADVTTTGAGANDPTYGVPDGTTDLSDLLFFVNQWDADLGSPTPNPGSVADVTTTGANPGDPGHGIPDNTVDLADLLHYINEWSAGAAQCP